jgi:hypothetical protein
VQLVDSPGPRLDGEVGIEPAEGAVQAREQCVELVGEARGGYPGLLG